MRIETDLADALEDVDAGRELTRDAANLWYAEANETLFEAGDDLGYDVHTIANDSISPRWDADAEAWRFGWPHIAAPFLEDGTTEHDVKAKEAEYLAFEWPDAPPEIREMFSETFPTVFFKEVTVSGLPAIRFAKRGRESARKFMEARR